MAVIAALLGALVAAGLVMVIAGVRPAVRRPILKPAVRRQWRSPAVLAVVLVLAGLVVALVTGWIVAVVLFPLIGLGVPYLIGKSQNSTDIAKLEAMEEWTRSLSGILTAGAGLEQALVATLRSAPGPLQPDVARLVVRLRARWTTPAAIRAFADDLNDPTGDIIATNLLLGAQKRGDGLATILEGLAESVALDIRARRQIEADAAKPRATARWVTVITTVILAALFFTGAYVRPYTTGIGQFILLALLGAYGGTLMWMKRTAAGPRPVRFLGDHASEAQP